MSEGKRRTAYVETYGCQMNTSDGELMEGVLERSGYSIGTSFAPDWGEGNVLSLYDGVDTQIVPGMVFHMPPALRIYGEFTVGVSETAVVTENGCRTLSTLPRELALY